MDIFVARQPIFDLQNQLYGYELLYRSSTTRNLAEGATAEQMASNVIIHSFVDIGLHRLTGGKIGFLNCSRGTLVEGYVELLPPQGLVIELLEIIEPDAEIVAVCQRLRAAGYKLALDDFEYHPRYEPLLRLVDIVKLDVLNRSGAELEQMIEPLRPYPVRLLAERVEDAAVHATCRALGCELFQGYHFSRPEILSKREMSTEYAAILRLMNLLRDDAVADARIEEAFRTDPALTYKLLRIVNSASVGGRGIESILHAIRLIGRAALGRWLALLMVASLGVGSGPNYELSQAAILRARLCERLADLTGSRSLSGPMFMVGLFSLLDALIGVPMEEILREMDLAPGVRDALLHRQGPYAEWLKLVEAYDQGRWDDVSAQAERIGLATNEVPELYLEALGWARTQLGAVAA